MLLLVTDTSGRDGSVALARAGEGSNPQKIEVIESAPLSGGTFSAQLVPQIAALLTIHGLSKSALDAFIVVSGPGSFTGLRVGLAAIKALAEILGKPIVPVSLLEVIAVGSAARGKVFAALDAGRGEVYVGEYVIAADSVRKVNERILARADFLAETPSLGQVVTSDTALLAGLPVTTVPPADAAAIASLGWHKIQTGETVSPEQLEANYIRRSDAEIFGKGSLSN